MKFSIIENDSIQYLQMCDLRNAILRYPLGLELTLSDIEQEIGDLKIGAFEYEKIIGCCVLTRTDEKEIRLRQMAVEKSLQGKGIGGKLMQFAEKTAKEHGYQRMTLHARKTALGFYEKLGFEKYGEEFEEVSIPHFAMQKTL